MGLQRVRHDLATEQPQRPSVIMIVVQMLASAGNKTGWFRPSGCLPRRALSDLLRKPEILGSCHIANMLPGWPDGKGGLGALCFSFVYNWGRFSQIRSTCALVQGWWKKGPGGGDVDWEAEDFIRCQALTPSFPSCSTWRQTLAPFLQLGRKRKWVWNVL